MSTERKFTKAGREAISVAQKKRWAKFRRDQRALAAKTSKKRAKKAA